MKRRSKLYNQYQKMTISPNLIFLRKMMKKISKSKQNQTNNSSRFQKWKMQISRKMALRSSKIFIKIRGMLQQSQVLVLKDFNLRCSIKSLSWMSEDAIPPRHLQPSNKSTSHSQLLIIEIVDYLRKQDLAKKRKSLLYLDKIMTFAAMFLTQHISEDRNLQN